MKRACNTLRQQLVARMWSELNIQTGGLTTVRTTNNLDVNTPTTQLWTLFGWSSPSLSPTSLLQDRGGAPKNPLTKPTFTMTHFTMAHPLGVTQSIPTVAVKCTDFLWALITMSRLERFQTELPLLREWHCQRTSLLRVLWSQCFTSSNVIWSDIEMINEWVCKKLTEASTKQTWGTRMGELSRPEKIAEPNREKTGLLCWQGHSQWEAMGSLFPASYSP